MTDPRAEQSAKKALAREYARAELEALAMDAASITADYVMLLGASMKADGTDREPWAESLLAETIQAGCNAKNAIRRRIEGMAKDGSEYRIIEGADE